MADISPGWGPQGFQSSGGPQAQSAEQKLQSMMQAMGGAPNSVLMMIARILQSGGGAGPQNSQQWDRAYQMPPARPDALQGINGAMPMRPTEPPMMMDPNPGFVRG
jgi:hypothetical protein